MEQRIRELSQRCVDTHTPEDIWEHLEEELAELLLAIKRVKREREGFENLLEELIDVKIEVNTVLTLIDNPVMVAAMLERKLNKFETMLDKEKATYSYKGATLSMVNRYKPVPMIKGV